MYIEISFAGEFDILLKKHACRGVISGQCLNNKKTLIEQANVEAYTNNTKHDCEVEKHF